MINYRILTTLAALLCVLNRAGAENIVLFGRNIRPTIVYSKQGPALDSIAAGLLSGDLYRVTGYRPPVRTSLSNITGPVIVIGNGQSPLVKQFAAAKTFLAPLRGKWECYGLKVVVHPTASIPAALVVAGSDPRGTAYGVFSISEMIGVSPWYWWADIPVQRRAIVSLSLPAGISKTPSVKYRGIFLNDEDWGLHPWAAKTFEPETGDIGPKTYSKIFELLLRLKANLIWPAMHPSTKAFYSYPGNKKVAADYHIVVGSSHAEPMLRNNVGEWNEKTMGAFNYLTNKDRVFNYWEERVKEASAFDAIYTMGMRGVHDSGIEGVKTVKEAVPLVERIISDERGLLQKYVSPKVETVPQVFTAYKEVLEIYDSGLKLPEDITLVWPDDNYGYIQRLNNDEEKKRSGGSGVYYHASYWGRPHDYLWLSSTNPALIHEEMMKAYNNGTRQLWVVNVGDIKPLEYNIQLFLDMAYNIAPYRKSPNLYRIAGSVFSTGGDPQEITDILKEYYRLAFERRPEFMGWSQTEPTTQTKYTEYNHFYYGDQAQKRIDSYNRLERQVKALRMKTAAAYRDAFYELVYYPVVCAAWMNKKFLYRDKSMLYAKQNRLSAFDYAKESKLAYDSIRMETAFYNDSLAGGKWKNILSMEPRSLPVYKEPDLEKVTIDHSTAWGLAPEGWADRQVSGEPAQLPEFNYFNKRRYFIDLFLSDEKAVDWKAVAPAWIKLSRESGSLRPLKGLNEIRLWVEVDWKQRPDAVTVSGNILFSGGEKRFAIGIRSIKPADPGLTNFRGAVEDNGYLAIKAADFSRVTNVNGNWGSAPQLGSNHGALSASWSADAAKPAVVEYDFYLFSGGSPVFNISTLPSFPLNNTYGMRYRIGIDNGPVTEIDFKTVGRTEEWKTNVLRNSAIKQFKSQPLKKGKHTLKIYPLDPGIVFQGITADFGGLKQGYGPVK